MKKFTSILITIAILTGVIACAPFNVGAITEHKSEDGLFEYKVLDGKYAELKRFLPSGITANINNIEYNEDGSYTIPSSIDGYEVRNIGDCCFMWYCIPAKKVIIPDTVLYIGEQAFAIDDETLHYRGKERMEEIFIPSSVTYIGAGAFCCNRFLKKADLSSGVICIEHDAFRESGITEITVPETVKMLGENCFLGCTELTSAEINVDTYCINRRTFYNCKKLTSVKLSDNVYRFCAEAFYGCTSLKSFDLYRTNDNYYMDFDTRAVGYTRDPKTDKDINISGFEINYSTNSSSPFIKKNNIEKIKLNYHLNEYNKSTGFFAGEVINLKTDGKEPVNWKSSNNKVIKITSDGKITTLSKGNTTITAIFKDGTKYNTHFYVDYNPYFIKGGKEITAVNVKKGKTLKVAIDGKAYTINNKYTNTKKAKIVSKPSAKTLKIKGLKRGTTTLKVKVNGVKTLKLKVKVK